MKGHFLSDENQKYLFDLELRSDFETARIVLRKLLLSVDMDGDLDYVYETAAARLRLACYHYLCEDHSSFVREFNQARSILPDPDLFALLSLFLARHGSSRSFVREMCTNFFSSLPDNYAASDEISKYYFEEMVELRKRLDM